jgi:ferredoxin/flavodoxin---NADP+ reductase
MSAFFEQKVVSVHHWTDRLFSFTCTRDPSFRFINGEFTMLGLQVNDKPLLRAYSLASANYEEHLEFLSIKVHDGPLTSRLQHLKVGDAVLIGRKPTGTLVLRDLLPGKRLIMLATGTGLAPFMSLIRDPEIYEAYETVILVHGTRLKAEHAYKDYIRQTLADHEFLGEMVSKQLRYYPTVTREPYKNQGRVTDLVSGGKLFADLAMPPLNLDTDRIMICGSMAMNKDMKSILAERGFVEGNRHRQGHVVVERAFVES